MRKYLNYGKHKVGLMVWAMVMSVMFGCVFARGAGAISYSISYIENVATSMSENELSGLTGAGGSTTLSPTSTSPARSTVGADTASIGVLLRSLVLLALAI